MQMREMHMELEMGKGKWTIAHELEINTAKDAKLGAARQVGGPMR